MSTLTYEAERIAAAGRSRALAPAVGVPAGSAAFVADAFRGWVSNPTAMQVQAPTAKRHDLTPAPGPEEASP